MGASRKHAWPKQASFFFDREPGPECKLLSISWVFKLGRRTAPSLLLYCSIKQLEEGAPRTQYHDSALFVATVVRTQKASAWGL